MSIQISGQDVIDDSKNIVNVVAYFGDGVATKSEAEEGTNNDQLMTPLRVKQAIEAIMGTTTPERTGNYFTYSAHDSGTSLVSDAGRCLIDRKGQLWLAYGWSSTTRRSAAGRPGSLVGGQNGVGGGVYTSAPYLCGMAQNPDTGAFIWAGLKAIQRSVDPVPKGAVWSTVQSISGTFAYLHIAHYGGNNTFLVAGSENGTLWRSTDDGLNFTEENAPGGSGRRPTSISGWNNRWLYLNSNNIQYSTDNANNWTEIGTLSTLKNLSGYNGDELRSVHVSRKTGTLFVAGHRGVMRSTDNGANWTYVRLCDSNHDASFDHFAEAPNGALFLGAGVGHLATQPRGSVFRSTDDGATWTVQIGTNPGELTNGVRGLACGPNNEVLLNITVYGTGQTSGMWYAYSDYTTTAGDAMNSVNNLRGYAIDPDL